MILLRLLPLLWLFFARGCIASEYYNESLSLKPLPGNKLLASFDFEINSLPTDLKFFDQSTQFIPESTQNHFSYFPRALGPIFESTNARELHLRFTQGWWDHNSWGSLVSNGHKSGGTGVEVWGFIEAANIESARKSWFKLTKLLSGFFCASLNFIDDSITTSPKFTNNQRKDVSDSENKIFLLRAALPNEPICTENLTPFLKLLPTRGKAGVSSLLEGHRLFDSLWHSMSIDISTDCSIGMCHLHLNQSVNTVIDVMRSLRRDSEGGIPKPTPGDKLRCDTSKEYNSWSCFPLEDSAQVEWNLETLFGKSIKGSAFLEEAVSSSLTFDIDSNNWDVYHISDDHETQLSGFKKDLVYFNLTDSSDYNFKFKTQNSKKTADCKTAPITVSRSLTGYSQDKGGFRVVFTNPSQYDPINFVYFETLPWYMRLYLSTTKLEYRNATISSRLIANEEKFIRNMFYRPSIDRQRPSHLELQISIPPATTLILTYDFDKSLLLYAEYPPDANHGFSIEPAVVSVFDDRNTVTYELRTTTLLLSLPTPDFSMPYNVIILTCTVMSLAFGSIFNLLTKKVITEEDFEKLSESKEGLGKKIQERLSSIKSSFISKFLNSSKNR